jgi:hypothetical protein
LTPGGNSTVHIYKQTASRYTDYAIPALKHGVVSYIYMYMCVCVCV